MNTSLLPLQTMAFIFLGTTDAWSGMVFPTGIERGGV